MVLVISQHNELLLNPHLIIALDINLKVIYAKNSDYLSYIFSTFFISLRLILAVINFSSSIVSLSIL